MRFNGLHQEIRKAGIHSDPDVRVPMFGCNSSLIPIISLLSKDRFSLAVPKHPQQ